MTPSDLHARAVARFGAGDPAGAAALLGDAIAQQLDPELVNDLGVALDAAGRTTAARAVLEALRVLSPDFAPGRENLAALGGAGHDPASGRWEPASTGHVTGSGTPDADRRAAFLQVVAEAQGTHLADNVDHLFEPWGRELPDPAATGRRLAEQLAVLDACDALWTGLGDEASRDLLLRYLAYRALGPAHVRLQLDPHTYRRTVIGLTAQLIREAGVHGMPGLPYEWAHHVYDFTAIGLPLRLAGPPLPLASTLAFSQYAYRDAAVPARPRPGDVALDIGGCWGETALWLAHEVGPTGLVHSFEPSPQNAVLLRANLDRNPALAARVQVHPRPLSHIGGRELWMDDATAAGATTHEGDRVPEGRRVVPVITDTVDDLVARDVVARVDFVKVDVEGAELDVLRGAAHTLRTQRPRLALAAYHRPHDLATLPAFVASLGLAYRWYLQCSTMTDIDTVLFGVPVP